MIVAATKSFQKNTLSRDALLAFYCIAPFCPNFMNSKQDDTLPSARKFEQKPMAMWRERHIQLCFRRTFCSKRDLCLNDCVHERTSAKIVNIPELRHPRCWSKWVENKPSPNPVSSRHSLVHGMVQLKRCLVSVEKALWFVESFPKMPPRKVKNSKNNRFSHTWCLRLISARHSLVPNVYCLYLRGEDSNSPRFGQKVFRNFLVIYRISRWQCMNFHPPSSRSVRVARWTSC